MNTIRIEVRGGVAELVDPVPPGCRVVIHDYDEEAATDDYYEPAVYEHEARPADTVELVDPDTGDTLDVPREFVR